MKVRSVITQEDMEAGPGREGSCTSYFEKNVKRKNRAILGVGKYQMHPTIV